MPAGIIGSAVDVAKPPSSYRAATCTCRYRGDRSRVSLEKRYMIDEQGSWSDMGRWDCSAVMTWTFLSRLVALYVLLLRLGKSQTSLIRTSVRTYVITCTQAMLREAGIVRLLSVFLCAILKSEKLPIRNRFRLVRIYVTVNLTNGYIWPLTLRAVFVCSR